MSRSGWCILLAAIGTGLGACQAPSRPTGPTTRQIVVPDRTAKDAVFESCAEVLRRHRFQLDRVDRRAGLITTFPVTSQQFFEFWRNDVVTPDDVLEASLMSVSRRAEVRLLPPETPGPTEVVVRVYRQKLSTPERQYNSSTAALKVFGPELPSTSGKRIVPERDTVWLPRGRDGALEQRLLDEILARAPSALARTSGEPPTPAPQSSPTESPPGPA